MTACTAALTPRLEDVQAPHDYWAQSKPPKQSCEPPVPVVSSAEGQLRPHQVISSLSASCYPGARRLCEQRLSARGCELHADAVVMDDAASGPIPAGSSGQSQISLGAHAVRWTD